MQQPERPPAVAWIGKRVHFIGIGGVGMSGAARMLHAAGAVVSGSDLTPSPVTDDLRRLGIPVASGHDPGNLPPGCDLVVITAAIPQANAELLAALRAGVPVWKYARLLGELSSAKSCIAVSGTHGKTTTTSMIACALQEAGFDPDVIVGGRVRQLGGSVRMGKGPHFVVEACEYDRSFLHLTPYVSVINNVDNDHLDCFRDMEDLIDAFAGLAARVRPEGRLFVNADNAPACLAALAARCRVETFGATEACDWRVGGVRRAAGRTRFAAYRRGLCLGRFVLGPPGAHNVRNALAAIAVAASLGAPIEAVRRALRDFRGADRRLQLIGHAAGVLVLDDYAHHPTEISVTLAAARGEYPRQRLWCVFQPHQCSRTRILLGQFAASFRSVDRVIVPDIYSVRDTDDDRRSVHASDLVERIRAQGTPAEYIGAFDDIVGRLAGEVRPGDVVITMGAGPVDSVARALLSRLEPRPDVAAA